VLPRRDLGVEVVIAKQDLDLWSTDEEGQLTAAALERQWQVVVQDRVEPRTHLLAKRGNPQRGSQTHRPGV
jgi:predicted RecB family endonuclease